MKTLAKSKKPARRAPSTTRAKRPAPTFTFPVSDKTGLPFKPLAPGQKPITQEALKAALADSL